MFLPNNTELSRHGASPQLALVCIITLILLVPAGKAQTTGQQSPPPAVNEGKEIQVNWLYGAYVDKDVPLRALSSHERLQLFVRQSFTTPGVYAKTAFFALSDQAQDHPPEWGDGFQGYLQRTGSRYGQFVAQNALSGAGNALLGYEPRYNRCRCTGFWLRTRHAVLRNFITYDRTEEHIRPQLALYAGAFGAGVIAGTWQPGSPSLLTKGYQGVVTQAAFGVCANWLGEFMPDIMRVLKKKKAEDSTGR
ncbi:MAG TPA: hypothetical protein VME86_16525 [Acidobacteriaceae bacterium]|nr:hypothetical protein [Acidobacteriaceae bacterium]